MTYQFPNYQFVGVKASFHIPNSHFASLSDAEHSVKIWAKNIRFRHHVPFFVKVESYGDHYKVTRVAGTLSKPKQKIERTTVPLNMQISLTSEIPKATTYPQLPHNSDSYISELRDSIRSSVAELSTAISSL